MSETTASDSKRLKKINVLNDYVAIMRDIKVPDGLSIDNDKLQHIGNEGIVVGIGSYPTGWAQDALVLGDRVIFQRKVLADLTPESGGYAGRSVVIVKIADVLVKLSHDTEHEIYEG